MQNWRIFEAFYPFFMQFYVIGIIASPLPYGRVSKFDTVLIGLFRSTSFFYYNVFRGFSQANIQVWICKNPLFWYNIPSKKLYNDFIFRYKKMENISQTHSARFGKHFTRRVFQAVSQKHSKHFSRSRISSHSYLTYIIHRLIN